MDRPWRSGPGQRPGPAPRQYPPREPWQDPGRDVPPQGQSPEGERSFEPRTFGNRPFEPRGTGRPPFRPRPFPSGQRPGGPPARPSGSFQRPTDAYREPARSFVPATTAAVEPPGPDEEIVAGRRPVEEAFVARRQAFRLLVTPQRRAALERIVLHATSLRIPIVEVEGGSLTAVTGFDGHQGVALVVAARRYATLEDVLARAIERGEAPFVLALDSLEDPQNVGTLLRSAEAAGVHGVIFPTHRQAPLTPAAVKASAGAVEHLLLVPVDDLAGALTDLHVRGLRVAGAEAEAPMTARDSDLRGPLVLVVGSEGQGLGPAVRRRCDLVVRIPMRGAIGSLNAAVAGSVLLFEAVAQRDPDGSAGAAAPGVAGSVPAPAPRGRRPSWDDPGDAPDATLDPAPAPVVAAALDPAPAPVPVVVAEPAPAKKLIRAKPKATAPVVVAEPAPAKRPARSKVEAPPTAAPARASTRAKPKTAAIAKLAASKPARRARPGPAAPSSIGADEDTDLLPD